jgi:hypothetical protein
MTCLRDITGLYNLMAALKHLSAFILFRASLPINYAVLLLSRLCAVQVEQCRFASVSVQDAYAFRKFDK